MKKLISTTALFSILATASLQMQAQTTYSTSVPYSTSSVRGSTIITNYYDPNFPTTRGGLTTTPFQSGTNPQLGRPLDSTSVTTQPLIQSSPYTYPATTYPSATYPSTIYPTTTIPATTYPTSTYPLSTLPATPTAPGVTYPVTYPTTSPTITYPGTTTSTYNTTTVPTGLYTGTTIPNVVLQAPATAAAVVPGGYVPPGRFEDPTYTFPGLVARVLDRWVGSDYLYEMPVNIGVVIEVVQPTDRPMEFEINQDVLRQEVMRIFAQRGINPQAMTIGFEPPSPFFHVLILVYPGQERYTAFVSGRLFEKVEIPRFNFKPPGTWQAITWEKQDLVITPSSQFNEQLGLTIGEIASTFADRVRYFADQKFQMESDIKIKMPYGPTGAPRIEKIIPPTADVAPDGRRPMPDCECCR